MSAGTALRVGFANSERPKEKEREKEGSITTTTAIKRAVSLPPADRVYKTPEEAAAPANDAQAGAAEAEGQSRPLSWWPSSGRVPRCAASPLKATCPWPRPAGVWSPSLFFLTFTRGYVFIGFF